MASEVQFTTFEAAKAIQLAEELEASAKKALAGFMTVPVGERIPYVAGQITYWRNVRSAMRFYKSQVKQRIIGANNGRRTAV